MKRLGSSHQEEEADIDITPMLDVVFIMLIFFIVTASFVKESGIDLHSPPPSQDPPPINAPRPIIVKVSKLNEIMVQDRRVDHRSIKATVIRLKAESPESSVTLKVHPESKTRAIVQAVDGIRSAGVNLPSITFGTD